MQESAVWVRVLELEEVTYKKPERAWRIQDTFTLVKQRTQCVAPKANPKERTPCAELARGALEKKTEVMKGSAARQEEHKRPLQDAKRTFQDFMQESDDLMCVLEKIFLEAV